MVESTDTVSEIDDAHDAPVTAEERQEAVKLVTRLLAAALAVVLAAGVATYFTRDDDGGDSFGGEVTLINAIGPLAGRDLTSYIADRRNELGQVRDRRAAVVSLKEYMSEDQARRLFDGLPVRALLVAAPGGRATLVKGDLAQWAERTRTEAAEERQQFEGLIPTLDPEDEAEFIDDYKEQIQRLTRLEAEADASKPVVFAVVTIGEIDDLRGLASTTGVRLVDVGAGPTVPEDRRIRGIRPEETVTAGDPITRPV
jgi:hypothetical protein